MSGERIYISSQVFTDNEKRHIARYNFAGMFTSGVVLDVACGCGYGSKILSKKASCVIGIDKSQDAIDYANKFNLESNIEYKLSDIETISSNNMIYDTIVSFETIEHLESKTATEFLSNVTKMIKTGGCFIGSSPMLRYKDGVPYITNPYHVNEMSKSELINMIDSIFNGFSIYYFSQKETCFMPLHDEDTGFCVFVARKK